MIYAMLVILTLFALNEFEIFNLYQLRKAYSPGPSFHADSDYQWNHGDELQRSEDSKRLVRNVLIFVSVVPMVFVGEDIVLYFANIFS
jgi:hypothetical protein